MFGQLKSTVQCLTCKNISVTFDPQLSICLPITRQVVLEIGFVPLKNYDGGERVVFPVVESISQPE